MTIFNGTRLGGAPGSLPGVGLAATPKVIASSYSISAALIADDIIVGPTVPKGATLLDVVLYAPDLDTDGTPAITLNVGTPASETAFISGSTVGQAGGVARASSGVPAVLAADTVVQMQVGTAPDVGATSGTITIAAHYLPAHG